MRRKSRGLAALLNFLLPGVGYLYVGRRVGFAVLLFIGYLIGTAEAFSDDGTISGLEAVASIIIGFAFAVDRWGEADRRNKGSLGEW